ncbi:MAG: molybdopterin-converting factor chain 2, partial [Gammaproteobacteria bacterium HGW-Gammaproteobacteria-7]
MKRFALSGEPIDAAALHVQLADRGAGAWLAFEGRVRNCHAGRAVSGLHYQAYVPLAVA